MKIWGLYYGLVLGIIVLIKHLTITTYTITLRLDLFTVHIITWLKEQAMIAFLGMAK